MAADDYLGDGWEGRRRGYLVLFFVLIVVWRREGGGNGYQRGYLSGSGGRPLESLGEKGKRAQAENRETVMDVVFVGGRGGLGSVFCIDFVKEAGAGRGGWAAIFFPISFHFMVFWYRNGDGSGGGSGVEMIGGGDWGLLRFFKVT